MKNKLFLIGFMFMSIVATAQMSKPSMYRNPEVENSVRYKFANEFQKDFLLFMDMLQTTHPAFCKAETVPFNVEQEIDRGFNALADNNDVKKFRLILMSVAAKLNDGHTLINAFDFENMKFYPLNLKRCDNKYYVRVTDREYSQILGMPIKYINNIPIDTLVNMFGNFISHENTNELNQRVTEYILLPYFWENLSMNRADSALFIEFYNDKNVLIFPKFRKDMALESIPEKSSTEITKPNSQLFSYNIDADKKICYLQFNSCLDYNTFVFQIEMTAENDDMKKAMYAQLESQKDNYPKFDEFLKQMFSDIKTKKASVLVVDVRNNGGGNSALCNQLLSYLKPYKKIKEISSYIRISELLKLQYPEIYQKAITANANLETGKLYDCKELEIAENDENLFKKFFPVNNEKSKIFKGKIFFMQGAETYSSAGELIITARDNKIGTIIGENSIFRPCNYGDILAWQLPNTNQTGWVSHKYFARPNQKLCSQETIIPDVLINTTFEDIINGNDKVWDWIINNGKRNASFPFSSAS